MKTILKLYGGSLAHGRTNSKSEVRQMAEIDQPHRVVRDLGKILQQLYILASEDDGDTTNASKMDERIP